VKPVCPGVFGTFAWISMPGRYSESWLVIAASTVVIKES
jgi:hypothetical protein